MFTIYIFEDIYHILFAYNIVFYHTGPVISGTNSSS